MSKVNKTVSAVVAGAMTALTCLPAMAMDLRAEQDENVMAYWSFKLGGDEGRVSERQSFGFAVNAPLGDNSAFSAYQSSDYLNQPASRPALMSMTLGLNGSFDRFSLNGNKIIDSNDILYADETEGDGMKVFGLEWYYAVFAALAVGATGYLVYDAFEDDDDDEAAGGGGDGGGTTGTPLDAVLDPLAGLAP